MAGRPHLRRRLVARGVLPGGRGARLRRALDGRAHRLSPADPRRGAAAGRGCRHHPADPDRSGGDHGPAAPPDDAREGAGHARRDLRRAPDRRGRRRRRLPEGVRGGRHSDGAPRAPNVGDDRDHAPLLDRGAVLLRRRDLPARRRLDDAEAASARRPTGLARRPQQRRDRARGAARRRLHAVHVHRRALPPVLRRVA